MSETNDRVEHLEKEVRRLRTGMLILALALVIVVGLSARDRTPEELTVRKLTIVDAEGTKRIVAATYPHGMASVDHYDGSNNIRIRSYTSKGGDSSLAHVDRDGNVRIATESNSHGNASINFYDRNQMPRIVATTLHDGEASIQHYDREGNRRVMATTVADGKALIGINDGNEQLVWAETSSK